MSDAPALLQTVGAEGAYGPPTLRTTRFPMAR